MSSRRGFTLIEVILALTILLVVLMLLATSTGRTVHTAAIASAQAAAQELALDRIESIRADPRYDAIDTLYTGTETSFPTLPGYSRTTRIVRVGGIGQANDYKRITVTVTGPTVSKSLAGMLAVTRVLLSTVVGRGCPFQRTLAPARKVVPLTVSVKPGPPWLAAGGLRAVTVGETTS